MTVSGIRGKPSLRYKYYMTGIKEIIGYHDKADGYIPSMTQRFIWEDSPLWIKLSRFSNAMNINFNQIPNKLIMIQDDKTKEYTNERCGGIHINFSEPYWNNIKIIFDNGTTAEYDIPDDTESLFLDLTQYVESNYEEVPAPEDQRLASLLLDDDDMLDI